MIRSTLPAGGGVFDQPPFLPAAAYLIRSALPSAGGVFDQRRLIGAESTWRTPLLPSSSVRILFCLIFAGGFPSVAHCTVIHVRIFFSTFGRLISSKNGLNGPAAAGDYCDEYLLYIL